MVLRCGLTIIMPQTDMEMQTSRPTAYTKTKATQKFSKYPQKLAAATVGGWPIRKSWSFQPFLQSSLQSVPILYNGPPLPSVCPFPWGSGPSSYTWFLRPTRVLNPNSILISWIIFAWHSSVLIRRVRRGMSLHILKTGRKGVEVTCWGRPF